MYYTHPTRDSAWPKKKKKNFATRAAKPNVYLYPLHVPQKIQTMRWQIIPVIGFCIAIATQTMFASNQSELHKRGLHEEMPLFQPEDDSPCNFFKVQPYYPSRMYH